MTKKISDVTFRIQKSARSLPKVVHYNRLKLYEGRNPSVWFREKDAPVETTQEKASQTNATTDTDRTVDDMEHAIDTITR